MGTIASNTFCCAAFFTRSRCRLRSQNVVQKQEAHRLSCGHPWASLDRPNSLCREKDLRVRGAGCPNCRFPLHNRGRFGRDRLYFRKSHEQCFNLALLIRLWLAGLCHDVILSRCSAEEKRSDCTVCRASSAVFPRLLYIGPSFTKRPRW